MKEIKRSDWQWIRVGERTLLFISAYSMTKLHY